MDRQRSIEIKTLFGNVVFLEDGTDKFNCFVSSQSKYVIYEILDIEELELAKSVLDKLLVSNLIYGNKLIIFFSELKCKIEKSFHEKLMEFLMVQEYFAVYGKCELEIFDDLKQLLRLRVSSEEFCKRTFYNWELVNNVPCVKKIWLYGKYYELTREERKDVYGNYVLSLKKNNLSNRVLFQDRDMDLFFANRKNIKFQCNGVCKEYCSVVCPYRNVEENNVEVKPVVMLQGDFELERVENCEKGLLLYVLHKSNQKKQVYLPYYMLYDTRTCQRAFAQKGINFSNDMPDRCWDDFMRYVNDFKPLDKKFGNNV